MSEPPAAAPALVVRARERPAWKTECLRAAGVVAASAALALAVNFRSPNPVPLLAADGPGALPERARRIGAAELRELLAARRAVLFLDVRRDEPFKAGHAPGALHAATEEFAVHYQDLDLATKLLAAEEVVLICEADECPSADRVAKFLKELQHTNVRVYHGGWTAYVQAGFPLEGAR